MSAGRVHPSILLGAVAAVGIANLIAFAFLPALLTHAPLLLIALSPLGRHLVLAAPLTELVPFLIVGTLRRMVASTLGFALGRAYGGNGVAWVKRRYPKFEYALSLLERAFARAAPLIIFVAPGPLVCALAGATGMRAWVVLPIATAGQTGWMLVNYKLGEAFSEWLRPINEFIAAHTLPLTLVCIALAVGYRWLRRRKQRGAIEQLVSEAQAIAPADAEPAAGASVPPSEPHGT